ncbi:hypothetical protein ANCCAN_08846 [Ancylostoma caninum]|uniref:SCP domain-containing protein n=1 Tax=Ancylostoma caninum TaxID=29170 RepID=A0A368GPF3_ANCCA|nr:hypothetical protein ANCCAN_08846 [Ancylostoma caninum]
MKAFLTVIAILTFQQRAFSTNDFESFPSENRHIIIENTNACSIAANFRAAFDDFHNGLRQNVSRGVPYNSIRFQKRLMYGLIYDCELEKKAAEETMNPGSAINYGVVNFTMQYTKSVLKAVKEGLVGLLNNTKALNQVIYPKATRFGCWGILKKENKTRQVLSTCVYDKKAEMDSLITKEACTTNENCTYYNGSTCLWSLCYAKKFF